MTPSSYTYASINPWFLFVIKKICVNCKPRQVLRFTLEKGIIMSTRDITRVAMYTALTSIVAVVFRFLPTAYVPFSILPLMVLLAGFVLGPRLGAMSMALYALLGLIGVPVFAKGGGPAYVLSPSFGFILGYTLAAFAVGWVLQIKKRPGIFLATLAVLSGLACLYAVGLTYFYVVMNFYLHKSTSFIAILEMGFFPFIALDLAKAAGAITLGRLLGKSLQSNRIQGTTN